MAPAFDGDDLAAEALRIAGTGTVTADTLGDLNPLGGAVAELLPLFHGHTWLYFWAPKNIEALNLLHVFGNIKICKTYEILLKDTHT